MKCIEGLAKQHRPLFLAGLLAFENHGLSDEMRRLINIFEFMTIKGGNCLHCVALMESRPRKDIHLLTSTVLRCIQNLERLMFKCVPKKRGKYPGQFCQRNQNKMQ